MIFSRIVQKGLTSHIPLVPEEYDVYRGCGWKIACFGEGILVDTFDPMDLPQTSNLPEELARESVNAARQWMLSKDQRYEFWLGMFSCRQILCPVKTSPHDIKDMMVRFYIQFEAAIPKE